jgi:hypothetical protein
MTPVVKPGSIFLLIALFCCHVDAKAWRGIVPFHSNRTDVEQVVGQTSCQDENGIGYESETESVYFVLAPDDNSNSCSAKIPRGTVLQIEITPKTQIRLADLAVDKKNLVLLDTKQLSPQEFKGYADSEDGIVIRIINDAVDTIFYIPEKRDRDLCPAHYPDPKTLVLPIVCKLCPVIQVVAPDKIESGKLINFTAKVTGVGRCVHLTFDWTTSEGQIVEGQGTPSIKVDTKSISDKKMWAAVTIGGLDRSCTNHESVVTELTGHP